MHTTKKKFIAPAVTKVTNEPLMAAGACNEQFIYTSAGGVKNNGYAQICYHFPKIERVGSTTFISFSSNNAGGNKYSTEIVNIPPGCTFVPPARQGQWTEGNTQYSVTDEVGLGWTYFKGTNGDCHFLGYIYLPNGTLISNANVMDYAASNILNF